MTSHDARIERLETQLRTLRRYAAGAIVSLVPRRHAGRGPARLGFLDESCNIALTIPGESP